jgi:phosphatidylglycerophosphate synthase
LPIEKFSYEKTLKTKPENSFLNLQSFLYLTSGQLTKLLYYTPVTPHQVIFISMVFGVVASYMIIQDNKIIVIAGAVLLFYKNVLDKVDGSLARAKNLDSRRGRFYDSISDFIVTFTLFTAISYKLYLVNPNPVIFVMGYTAMVSSMLQCSFFIYYQVSFIKLSGKSTVNRLVEKVTQEDMENQDKLTLLLQRIFMLIYGWQDILFASFDNYQYKRLEMAGTKSQSKLNTLWYSDKPFLTMSSSLSIGTHLFLVSIFAVAGNFKCYLFVNLILMNLLLISFVIYHYYSVKRKLSSI